MEHLFHGFCRKTLGLSAPVLPKFLTHGDRGIPSGLPFMMLAKGYLGLFSAKALTKRKVIPFYPAYCHAPGTSILGLATSRSGMLVPMATIGHLLLILRPTPATSTLIRRMSTRPTETIAPTAFPSGALRCARSPYCAALNRRSIA